VIGRGLDLTERVWLVAAIAEARELGFCTGTSDHSRDQRVRSGAQRVYSSHGRSDAAARPVTFDRTRPVTSGPLLDSNRTPGVTRPVSSSSASGHVVSNTIQQRPDAATVSSQFDRRVWSVRRQRQLVPNGSILWDYL
jgi:hypothetical protein